MNKKQDLLNVFSFIAEFLREEETVPTKKLLVETSTLPSSEQAETNILNHLGIFQNDTLTKLKAPMDNLGKDAKYIKDLMDRVESKSVDQAITNNLLANQKKEFDKEIQKLKEDFNDKLKTEKQTENEIENSGSTVTVIGQDKVEDIIQEDKDNTKGQSTRYKAANFLQG